MAQPPPPTSAARPLQPPVPREENPVPGPVPIPVPVPVSVAAPPLPPQQHTRPPPQPQTPPLPLHQQSVQQMFVTLDRHMQLLLDRIAPHRLYRWLALAALLALFLLRTFLLEGFYIVIYVLFIFILNQFILFLQPKDRASLLARAAARADGTDDDDRAPALPTGDADEFRPFVRRLPEFKFWYSTTYATVLAFGATFFKFFDIPVFWPVLLFYFVMLFVATMRRQWLDMKHLKYVPWDIGTKKVYKSDPKRVSVTRPQPQPAPLPASSPARTAPVPTVQMNKTPAISQ